MDEKDEILRRRDAIREVRNQLLNAQTLMDAIEPSSIVAARLQHLIDGLDPTAAPTGP